MWIDVTDAALCAGSDEFEYDSDDDDYTGTTALWWAAKNGHVEAPWLLACHGFQSVHSP